MTYAEAIEASRTGNPIRHPGMSRGWKIVRSIATGDLFYVNPHTGSTYLATLKQNEKERDDWSVTK